MVLTINIGNTSMTLGAYNDIENRKVFSFGINKNMTSDDFAMTFLMTLKIHKLDNDIKGIVFSSVCPTLSRTVTDAIQKVFGIKPLIIGPGIKTGLNIKINDPSELGSDLVCMSSGVIYKYKLPAILICIDNATTFSYIDENGAYRGTIIYAGMNTMLESLVDNADLLKSVSFTAPGKFIGTDTPESIQSGLIYGSASVVEGIINRMLKEFNPLSIVTTGCYSERLLPYIERKIEYDEYLLTDGMYHIYAKQKKGYNHI